jgi:hypothetical protein
MTAGAGRSDDGWTTVPARSRPVSAAGKAADTDEASKKQRQNAAKRDAVKAAKAEAEAERLARLQAHRLERMREQII